MKKFFTNFCPNHKKINLKIGYYVHHLGDGHRQRALAIASYNPSYFTLIGTNLKNKTHNINYVSLPCDIVKGNNYNAHLASTSYTPLREPIITQRMGKIAGWIKKNQPNLMVVDVSLEIAMLSRLFSIPTIYVRLVGNRWDSAHMDAFLAAEALLCPFSEQMELPSTPDWVKQKSFYFPKIVAQNIAVHTAEKNNLLVLLGAGGHEITIDNLINLAKQAPSWSIHVLGEVKIPLNINLPKNLYLHGWIKDYQPYIAKAVVVAGAAGDGVVNNVLAYKKAYICLPQQRPFDEQIEKAKALEKLGIEVIFDINNVNWAEKLRITVEKGPIITKIDDETNASDAFNFIINIAKRNNDG